MTRYSEGIENLAHLVVEDSRWLTDDEAFTHIKRSETPLNAKQGRALFAAAWGCGRSAEWFEHRMVDTKRKSCLGSGWLSLRLSPPVWYYDTPDGDRHDDVLSDGLYVLSPQGSLYHLFGEMLTGPGVALDQHGLATKCAAAIEFEGEAGHRKALSLLAAVRKFINAADVLRAATASDTSRTDGWV